MIPFFTVFRKRDPMKEAIVKVQKEIEVVESLLKKAKVKQLKFTTEVYELGKEIHELKRCLVTLKTFQK